MSPGGNGTLCIGSQINVSIDAHLPRLLLTLTTIRTQLLITRIHDPEYQYLFNSIQRLNNNLKSLVVFENFNQQYPSFMQWFMEGEDLTECHSTRNPDPAVSRAIALASLKLEHLAASFLVDARNFF